MKRQRIAVIGNGGFGTAMALILIENGHRVTIWGHDAHYVDEVRRRKENTKYLPGIGIPPDLELSSQPDEVLKNAQFIVNAVPTRFIRSVFEGLKEVGVPRVPIVSLTKGIEEKTLLRPSQILRQVLPGRALGVLSGPSHAEEVARRVPASVVVAARNPALARKLQELFTTERFRVYTNSDPTGVELAGALKNIISLAAGASDGLGFGDNTKSALVTRGLVEMVRLAHSLGARKTTFAGLAGLGDLMTSAFSPHGRNRAVGHRLGQGIPLERVLRETEKVAEGVYTTKGAMTLAKRHGVEMPITQEVHRMLFENKDPAEALRSLMSRSKKNESW